MKYCESAATETFSLLPDSVTVCATIDESGEEQEITELMIRRACEQMDADQAWPFSGPRKRVLQELTTRHGSAKIIPFAARSTAARTTF